MHSRKRRTGWRRPLGLLIGLYLGLAGSLRCFGDRLVFFPQLDAQYREAPPEGAEDVTFRTEDGLRLHGWWAESKASPWTFLVCHGNAGNVAGRVDMFQSLRKLGRVLLFDYRGYGRSEGSPSEMGLYRDARAAWAFLTSNKGVEPGRIVAYGQSLGSGVATRLARERPTGLTILEAPFTSVPDMADAVVRFLPIGWAMPVEMPTRENVAQSDRPLLVIHGTLDTVIPFQQGRKVYEAGRSRRSFLTIPRGGHNDLWSSYPDEMSRGIRSFLGFPESE